jgi:hypothetical protein
MTQYVISRTLFGLLTNFELECPSCIYTCENSDSRMVQTCAGLHALPATLPKSMQDPPPKVSPIGYRPIEVRCSCSLFDVGSLKAGLCLNWSFLWTKPILLVSTAFSFRAYKPATVHACCYLDLALFLSVSLYMLNKT